jgi:hypothetical protein
MTVHVERNTEIVPEIKDSAGGVQSDVHFHNLPVGVNCSKLSRKQVGRVLSPAFKVFINLDSVFHFKEFTLKK